MARNQGEEKRRGTKSFERERQSSLTLPKLSHPEQCLVAPSNRLIMGQRRGLLSAVGTISPNFLDFQPRDRFDFPSYSMALTAVIWEKLEKGEDDDELLKEAICSVYTGP